MSSGNVIYLSPYPLVPLTHCKFLTNFGEILGLGLGFVSPHAFRVSHNTMHILHSIAIVYIQVYEFLHDFVVEILGNISQIRQTRSPARSTGLSTGRPGVPPGQPDWQPARPVCRPVGPACAPDRPVFAQSHRNTWIYAMLFGFPTY